MDCLQSSVSEIDGTMFLKTASRLFILCSQTEVTAERVDGGRLRGSDEPQKDDLKRTATAIFRDG